MGRLSQWILQNSRFFSFILFLPYLETGKKCRKRFSDSQSDLKDCAGSQKELDEISSGITVYRVFLQRAYYAKKKVFAARKWKNSCISFFLFFSLIFYSQPPSWNSYNFFLGSFSLYLFFSWFSLKFNESYPVSTRTKGRRNYPMCRCNVREILPG